MKLSFLRVTIASALLLLSGGVPAQQAPVAAFPTQPVTIVVPFSPGGPSDTVARRVAAAMEKPLGQPVAVVNMPGSGGTLGANAVARDRPDGYRLLVTHLGMATAPALYRRLPFDPRKDFSEIGLINESPMTLLVRPGLAVTDLKDLIARARADPDALTLANAGVGAASHLCGLLLQQAIRVNLRTLPYRGTAPAIADLLAGRVDILCDQATNTTRLIREGRVRALAVTAPVRLGVLPDVPTAAEAGLSGLEFSVWHAMYAPAGTPQPVVRRLVDALQRALAEPALRGQFADLGADVVPTGEQTPQALAVKLRGEIDRWAPIIRGAGVYAD